MHHTHKHLERLIIKFVLGLVGFGIVLSIFNSGILGALVVITGGLFFAYRRWPRLFGSLPRPGLPDGSGLVGAGMASLRRQVVAQRAAQRPAGLFRVWDGIPTHVDALTGARMLLKLVGKSIAVGGTPGSGKTVFVRMLVAAAADDPECELYIVDGKRVGLGLWRHKAQGFATEPGDVIGMLQHVKDRMMQRYTDLEQLGEEEIVRGDGNRLLVVAIDELSYFTDRGAPFREETDVLLGSLVKLGRAAGVILILATQKPDATVISTQVRDNVGWRLAFRTRTREATEAILGSVEPGSAPAHTLPEDPGLGYLLAESGKPQLIKTYNLTYDDARRLAAADGAR